MISLKFVAERRKLKLKQNNIKGILYALIMITSMLIFSVFNNMHYVRQPAVRADSRSSSPSSASNSSFSVSIVSTVSKGESSEQDSSAKEEGPESIAVSSAAGEKEQEKQKYYDVPLSNDLQDLIFSECVSKNVPSDLVIALIDVESDFNPKLISKTNDYGLMQINICHKESLKKDLQITNLLDEKQNIKAGVYMLSGIVSKYSNVNQALMVYNCGEYGAKKLWNNGIFSTKYSKKVIEKIDEIKS